MSTITTIKPTLPDERGFTGWMPRMLTNFVSTQGLATNGDLEKELWSTLEYYLIDDVAKSLFSKQNITDKKLLKKLIHDFQSYIHQARNFYDYARNSDYRSSPLLFYYAFMNLAKARLIINDCNLHDKEFHHGLSRIERVGKFDKLSIRAKQASSVDRVSIFRELYKITFGVHLPTNKHIKLIDLFGYVSDITAEYEKTTGRLGRASLVKYATMIDNNRKVSWVRLAVYQAGKILSHKGYVKQFLKDFDEVKISNNTRQHIFDLGVYSANHFRYFESKKEFSFIGTDNIDTFSDDALLHQDLKGLIQSEVYDMSVGFQLVEPIKLYNNSNNRRSGMSQMNEMIAIYVAMYHLSEIVRYEPSYIDVLLSSDTKEGWMLRSFISSSPYTFLLRMLSSISNVNYFLNKR